MNEQLQEALDSLRTGCKATYVDDKGKRWYTTDKSKDERCNLLQELVDKEIPMKPILENDKEKFSAMLFFGIDAWCGKCENEVSKKDTYCKTCGQKLDWSDHDDNSY